MSAKRLCYSTFVIALFLSISLQAQIPPSELLSYRQTHPQRDDPQGDEVLFQTIKLIKSVITDWIFGGDLYFEQRNNDSWDQCQFVPHECTQEAFLAYRKEWRNSQTYTFLPSNDPPLNINGFVEMMLQVIREESERAPLWIFPHPGLTHKWSKEFLDRHNTILNPELMFPKILFALAFGASSRFMITDKESALIQEILRQPENSITVEWLFRTSFLLNRGDVYSTLLTIENVLSKNFLNYNRELLPVNRRLKGFSRGLGNEPDRFGMWYHLFGIILYSYATVDSPFWADSNLVAHIENLGVLFFHGNRNKQKQLINHQGAEIGKKLKIAMRHDLWKKKPANPFATSETFYLNRN